MEDAVLYVASQGCRLTRVGERLLVRSPEGRILQDIPFFRIEQIICMGSIEVSQAALITILRRGIDVVYLTLDGRFKCRLSNLQTKAVTCRRRQYERSFDADFSLRTAKSMLLGKLTNSRVWLMRQNRNKDEQLARQIAGVSASLASIPEAASLAELMGLEGTAARFHFEAMRLVLKQDLAFLARVRRPPTDPVNAMLSFGYTLLFHRVLSAVERVGLDPMLGNLHAAEGRKPALALDLMEEFRPLLVDSVVCGMVNRVEVSSRDFFPLDTKGIRMKEETLGRFVKQLQARLGDLVTHPVSGNSFSFKDMIVQQALQYKSLVLGDRNTYKPVVTR